MVVKKLFPLFAMLLLVTLDLGGMGHFVPSAPAIRIGGTAVIAIALAWAIFVLLSMQRQVEAQPCLIVLAIFAALTVNFNMGLLSLDPMIEGVPALYSRFYGKPAQRSVLVTGWHHRAGRGSACEGPLVEEIPGLLSNLCFYSRLAKGSRLNLYGRETALGLFVERIVVADTVARHSH